MLQAMGTPESRGRADTLKVVPLAETYVSSDWTVAPCLASVGWRLNRR